MPHTPLLSMLALVLASTEAAPAATITLDANGAQNVSNLQQIALALSVVVGLIGLTLVPLGKDPA